MPSKTPARRAEQTANWPLEKSGQNFRKNVVKFSGTRIPGAFVIDNCCLPGILDTEGPDLIGREIEYENGQLQFVDDPPIQEPRLIIPFPTPTRS